MNRTRNLLKLADTTLLEFFAMIFTFRMGILVLFTDVQLYELPSLEFMRELIPSKTVFGLICFLGPAIWVAGFETKQYTVRKLSVFFEAWFFLFLTVCLVLSSDWVQSSAWTIYALVTVAFMLSWRRMKRDGI